MVICPGIAPLTVATSGAAPGVIVTSGSGDAHGWWPGPLVAEGNDPRSAANLMAAVEAVTDRTNWIGWHSVDWIAGGGYTSLFTGVVGLGAAVTFDHSGVADGNTAVTGKGGSVGGIGVKGTGGGGDAVGVAGQASGVFPGVQGTGDTTGPGVQGQGGAASGTGVKGTAVAGDSLGGDFAGHGAGAGVRGTPGATAGTPAVLAHSGPARCDTHIAASTTAPTAGDLWKTNVCACWAKITFDGTNPPVVADGYNVASVAFADANINIQVTFATAAINANYSITATSVEAVGGSELLIPCVRSQSAGSFKVGLWVLNSTGPTAGQFGFVLGVPGFVYVQVFARQ